MKFLPHTIAVLIIAACVACGTVPTETLLDKEVIAMKSVTAGRQVATGLLRAGKLTLAQDQAAQAQFTLVATGIKAAVAANNPVAVDAKKAEAEKITATLPK